MKHKEYHKKFKGIPLMTNNHVHLVAMYPYYDFLNELKRIDIDLYNRIYILVKTTNTDKIVVPRYTLTLFNEGRNGMKYNDITSRDDWVNLADNESLITKDTYILSNISTNKWFDFEMVQLMLRTFVRHYKIYYYYWYTVLYENYKKNIFYLNVRGKVGTINTDVKFSERLYLVAHNKMDFEKFVRRLQQIAGDNIKKSDYKYIYKQYGLIKYESDLILFALNNFNKNKTKTEFIHDYMLMNFSIDNPMDNIYSRTKSVSMSVQYIMTFPKYGGDINVNMIMFSVYIGMVINSEYGFMFFNGLDFVGNEKETSNDIWYEIIERIKQTGLYTVKLIPHIGENRDINNVATKSTILFLLKSGIDRIGHGLVIPRSKRLMEYIKSENKQIFIEFCPISNKKFGYYTIKNNPQRKLVNNKIVKLMVCSDDNGIFGYKTVRNDYIAVYLYWNLHIDDIKELVINGLDVLDEPFKTYYRNHFNRLWDFYLESIHSTLL